MVLEEAKTKNIITRVERNMQEVKISSVCHLRLGAT